ncbi:MAG: hypothetical protein JRC87_07070 [Deltaproteobacteria bacterium]|nr:hypothetical protein [Deltaproteobacteria bacterium]
MLTKKYRDFLQAVSGTIIPENIITDPLKRAAIGADASFYHMVLYLVDEVTRPNTTPG